jgi:hypothetical protein
MKIYGEWRYKLQTRWDWVVRFMPQPLYRSPKRTAVNPFHLFIYLSIFLALDKTDCLGRKSARCTSETWEHWESNTERRRESKHSEKNMPQCHFVQHSRTWTLPGFNAVVYGKNLGNNRRGVTTYRIRVTFILYLYNLSRNQRGTEFGAHTTTSSLSDLLLITLLKIM